MKTIRVLVVDDSLFLRRTLPRILETDPEIKVVGAAADGVEALEMVKTLQPDVVTLDVLMPVMDGLTALKHIMRDNPTPVLMVSSVTHEGAETTLDALSLGAVDFVTKPSGPVSLDISKVRDELVHKIKAAYTAKIKAVASVNVKGEGFQSILKQLAQPPQPPSSQSTGGETCGAERCLVAIAASTGGPAALQLILSQLPANIKATILVVQHIAAGFTRPLIDRLNSLSPLDVHEAKNGEMLSPGKVLVAPQGSHLKVHQEFGELKALLDARPDDALHCPSANVLFDSLADCCASASCGVILTGMGEDGALGLRALHEKGGYTIAQDEATSVIYGMPRRAVELEAVNVTLPLERIAAEIIRATTVLKPVT